MKEQLEMLIEDLDDLKEDILEITTMSIDEIDQKTYELADTIDVIVKQITDIVDELQGDKNETQSHDVQE